MIKHSYIILLISITFIFNACGFKKINEPDSKIYYIKDISINGDNRISHLLKNEIMLASSEGSINELNISLDVKKNKRTKDKDISGKINKYTLEITASITIEEINSSKSFTRNFKRTVDYDVLGNHSDTINAERKTTIQITELISEDIVNFLKLNYKKK
tara:strand:+ start:206 stop:682 length:477 start_codon:yes stop_codon:yes gene_type:complete